MSYSKEANFKAHVLHPILNTRISVLLFRNAQGTYPPWILKMGGLESSNRRLISTISRTFRLKEEEKIFLNFFQIFFLALGLTRELLSSRIFLIKRNKKDFFLAEKEILIYLEFYWKNVMSWDLGFFLLNFFLFF